MTLEELKNRVIFQVNADADDLSDYEPHLTGYINRGYNLLLFALVKRRLPSTSFPELSNDKDTPKIPAWTHGALADYATWLVYRNGNPQKQSRGQAYLYAFQEVETECKAASSGYSIDGSTGEIVEGSTIPPQFYNVYPEAAPVDPVYDDI